MLFGHSGGGPTMSLYQALAENGPAYCRDPKRLVPCTEDFSGLTRADGIVFADAHPGRRSIFSHDPGRSLTEVRPAGALAAPREGCRKYPARGTNRLSPPRARDAPMWGCRLPDSQSLLAGGARRLQQARSPETGVAEVHRAVAERDDLVVE